jgi:predicted phage terminase large subunit-like protein
MSIDRADLIRRIQEQEAMEYALAERSLSAYVRSAWKVLEPNTKLIWGWHLDCICEHLEAVNLGQIKRLVINIPPRNLKSTTTTVCWPTWTWAQRGKNNYPLVGPTSRFIFTSYSQPLSSKHSMDRRTLMQSDWYQRGWGDRWSFSDDTNRQNEYANDQRGAMLATSMGGTATGRGGNVLVVDDPHDTTSASSDVQRKTDLNDFDQKFTSRLDDKANGAIVIVMQRLHTGDLSGHVLEKGGYYHLCLPATAPKRTVVSFPISKREVVREAGEILHPGREGKAVLEQAKKDQGSHSYAGQYDQTPVALEGGLFKRKWWQYYTCEPKQVAVDVMIQSWDFAVKDKTGNDFVVGLVVGRKGANRYVLDMVRDRMDFPASCRALKALSAKWPRTYKKCIEDKANGPAVIAQLKLEITGLVAIEPIGDKMQRASAVSPEVEAGNWHLPSNAPWLSDFLTELAAFPLGNNDDIVDAFSQGGYTLKNSGPMAMPQSGHGSGFVHGQRR